MEMLKTRRICIKNYFRRNWSAGGERSSETPGQGGAGEVTGGQGV